MSTPRTLSPTLFAARVSSPFLTLVAACGGVEDADPADAMSAVDAHMPDAAVDASPDAACHPSLRIRTDFQVNQVSNTSPSPLDVLVGHSNSVTVGINDAVLQRQSVSPGDPGRQLLVRADTWTLDFGGVDGNLLDGDVGQYLTRAVFGGSPGIPMRISAASDGETLELGFVPVVAAAHPYLVVGCSLDGAVVDDDGFPIVSHLRFRPCTVTFGDPRGAMAKTLSARNAAVLTLDYASCP